MDEWSSVPVGMNSTAHFALQEDGTVIVSVTDAYDMTIYSPTKVTAESAANFRKSGFSGDLVEVKSE